VIAHGKRIYYLSDSFYQNDDLITVMRKYRVGLFTILFFCFGTNRALSQSCVSSINGTVINFSCGINCRDINLQVPDLRTTSNYLVTTIPYNPYPYTTPLGNELTTLYFDDEFSEVIRLPFSFCFYDSLINTVLS